ncbi:hypothetical protein P168DRAFT_289049 [Aspergillus campestris IBT 28561]|uniref:Uncharacterized protein n=1 Tax=Aspergillus campestris (strain IBT 28561) TaxID=1392248 RepID=A0A2I1D6T9_ASPC2|nr:uncharacterized protein P168DRAFT_289049 [Aspergillus campestris IBT 28561]PKY05592.1 hypothetical protein P168DRAFT_289049 [Aspergillus campestris IBT 28561]
MIRSATALVLAVAALGARGFAKEHQEELALLRRACPDYTDYASVGQWVLPFLLRGMSMSFVRGT